MQTVRQLGGGWWSHVRRSFASKMIVTLVIFATVPLLIFSLLRSVDDERNALLLQSVQDKGRLIAEALFPLLTDFSPKKAEQINALLPRLAAEGAKIKLLFRPAPKEDAPDAGFFLVAMHPPVAGAAFEEERAEIVGTGLLAEFARSCGGEQSLAVRYVNAAGGNEVLTFVRSRLVENGCWVVLTSQAPNQVLDASIEESYWGRTEIKLALAIYLLMAVIVLVTLADVWRNLHRFRRTARAIRAGRGQNLSFAERNQIPELQSVVQEFDDLVATLRRSEDLIRQAAEENAHAFKGPLAVISQANERVRRAVAEDNESGQRAVRLIEQSVDRLDSLISAARKIEEATAEIMDRSLQPIDVAPLLVNLADDFREVLGARGIKLETKIANSLRIKANSDLLEVCMENLLENAGDFTAEGGGVLLSAKTVGGEAVVAVIDEGPGVPPEDLDRIFERYYSSREERTSTHGNFGIGLWVVRRNVEVMGGRVVARNRPEGGFAVELRFPLVRRG
ncbi:HAMP domain-containing sensor histidine kinase [Limibacillus sp. MBR-115]|uniref:sensor histidine kinase n=1 Tax=Limibacillus sp. MBR-115 TaxID=3156465 RepID=UPI003394B578